VPGLKELIERRVKRIETVPDKLLSSIDKANELLFKQMLKELNGLTISEGKYEATADNLARINAIVEALKKALFGSEYIEAVKEFASEIKAQAELNNAIMKATVETFTDEELYKSAVKQAQINAISLLDESAVSNEILKPLAEILTNSIVTGTSYTDTIESLRKVMTGDTAYFKRYAQTYVKDAFAISDRQYVQLTSEQYEIEFFEYDGGRVEGTRYFCCQRYGKIFHRNEIASWGEADKAYLWDKPSNASGSCATASGGGRKDNTNQANIFSYLGGWRCDHVLVPVATQYVPETIKAKARADGFFKD